MPDLYITWTPPSNTDDIESIVLYRKKDATNCEETLSGDFLYETTDFSTSASKFTDQDVPDGTWRYAAFSKNAAGLSPCTTDTYTVTTSPKGQTISFSNILDWQVAQGDFSLTATATSTLPVTFTTVDTDVLEINGNTVTPKNDTNSTFSRTVTITANQSGGVLNGEDWEAAPSVQKSFLLSDPDSDGDGIPDSREHLCQNFSASASSTANTEWGGANGTATATASGGSGSYTYLWGNGATTQTITGLSPNTTHTVTITDSNGCTESASTTVAQGASDPCANSNLSISMTNIVHNTIPGATYNTGNGSATALVSGGAAPYHYIWTVTLESQTYQYGNTTESISGLGPQLLKVTVIDANDCRAYAYGTINDNS